jgi:hypothetical protein
LLATLAILAGMLLVPASALASPVLPGNSSDAAHEETVGDVAYQNAPQPDRQYVFSVGFVDRVSAESLTLRFDDGATETYRLNGATEIQTQNGDELRRADLAVGEMAIVLSVENDPTAVTVVSGGAEGFHDAGPADIRGHDERECADCDAHAP